MMSAFEKSLYKTKALKEISELCKRNDEFHIEFKILDEKPKPKPFYILDGPWSGLVWLAATTELVKAYKGKEAYAQQILDGPNPIVTVPIAIMFLVLAGYSVWNSGKYS